jgi:hypothetical protein
MERALRLFVVPVLVASSLGIQAAELEPQPDASFIVPREQFLRRLDLTRPELAAVKKALDANDLPKAEHEFVTYWRKRPIQSPLLTSWDALARKADYKDATADAFLAGHLDDGFSVYEVPPTGIDWHGSPLCLLTYFKLLGPPRLAYHHTRDRKYLRFIVDYILDYMKAYPIEEFVGKGINDGWVNHQTVAKPWYWNMLIGRLGEWPRLLLLLRADPAVSDEELLQMLHRLYEETAYMVAHMELYVNLRHNGGAAMITSLQGLATIFQDFRQSKPWLDYDAQMAIRFIGSSFYPDGMCVELTTGYSLDVSKSMQQMAHALRDVPAMAAFKPQVAEMLTCLVALIDPNGRVPCFGDLYLTTKVTNRINMDIVEWVGLPWAATVKGETTEPVPPFTVWPRPGQEQWCGYYTMRSDWTQQARFMMIDGGPWGTTHRHGDRLSFVITACGENFITDPGCTTYASDDPEALTSHGISGFLHNTITVDGVDEFMGCYSVDAGPIPWEARAPLQNTWEHGGNYSLFAGDYSFAPLKPVKWERRVLFADKRYWLLQDVLTGEGPEVAIEQNFQFEPEIEIEFKDNITLAKAPSGAMLALVPLEGGLKPQLTIGDKEPHVSYWPFGKPSDVLFIHYGHKQQHGRGWVGRNTHNLIPAPAVTYVGTVDPWPPFPITLLIVPMEAGQTLDDVPKVTREGDVWTLPTKGGSLRFDANTRGCRVLP